MNENEGKKAAEQAAQYLANLSGASVAGFFPHPVDDGVYERKSELPDRSSLTRRDLHAGLYRDRNAKLAALVLLAALVKGEKSVRDRFMGSMRPGYFAPGSFERYLFQIVLDHLSKRDEVSISYIRSRIPQFDRTVSGEPSREYASSRHNLTWSQIVNSEPEPGHIERAIQLRYQWAKREGLLPESEKLPEVLVPYARADLLPTDDGLDRLPDKSLLPILDLYVELFLRRNVGIASFIILTALIKGNKAQRKWLLHQVKPEFFHRKLFRAFLFDVIVDCLRDHDEVSVPYVYAQIPKYGPKVWGEPSDERSLRGDYFTLAQILDFEPTQLQVERAIELRRMVARERGLLVEQEPDPK